MLVISSKSSFKLSILVAPFQKILFSTYKIGRFFTKILFQANESTQDKNLKVTLKGPLKKSETKSK